MTSIKIEGVDKLIAKLGNVEGHAVLRKPMTRAVLRLQAGMAKYPAQRAGSSYVRTGTLGRRWTHRISESAAGVAGKVGNNTSYGPLVQSAAYQSRIHSALWQTDEQVLKEQQPAIVRDFEQAISEALK